MAFCYAKNLDATKAPDFESDMVLAFQVVTPIFTLAKYSGVIVKMMRYMPMWLGLNFGPSITRAWFLLRKVSARLS